MLSAVKSIFTKRIDTSGLAEDRMVQQEEFVRKISEDILSSVFPEGHHPLIFVGHAGTGTFSELIRGKNCELSAHYEYDGRSEVFKDWKDDAKTRGTGGGDLDSVRFEPTSFGINLQIGATTVNYRFKSETAMEIAEGLEFAHSPSFKQGHRPKLFHAILLESTLTLDKQPMRSTILITCPFAFEEEGGVLRQEKTPGNDDPVEFHFVSVPRDAKGSQKYVLHMGLKDAECQDKVAGTAKRDIQRKAVWPSRWFGQRGVVLKQLGHSPHDPVARKNFKCRQVLKTSTRA